MMPQSVRIRDLGLVDYATVYRMQKNLVLSKRENPDESDYFLMVEHPDVYTLGRKSKQNEAIGLPNVFYIERGGQTTFHNPGQLVCYPILLLQDKERDLHLHLRRLEKSIIDALLDFEIEGERRDGETGVWIKGQRRKIASIGVAVSSWITFHGFALNVSNDLGGFSFISPCGYQAQVMTSMAKELGKNPPTIGRIKTKLLDKMSLAFERVILQ